MKRILALVILITSLLAHTASGVLLHKSLMEKDLMEKVESDISIPDTYAVFKEAGKVLRQVSHYRPSMALRKRTLVQLVVSPLTSPHQGPSLPLYIQFKSLRI